MKQIASSIKTGAAVILFFALMVSVGEAQERQLGAGAAIGGTAFTSGAAAPIGSGDLLEFTIFETPELSGKLRVSNTGDVFLPLIGVVHVNGLTAEECQHVIRQKFIAGNFLKDPQITVFIAEYATQGVSVMGEVHKPGVYPAFGIHHLLDYLSLAEGFTSMSGTAITITHADSQQDAIHVKVMAGAAPAPMDNPEIRPGDSIFVERTGIVYVLGEVLRPGGFALDHDKQLTILQAIALAQGTTYTAAKDSIKLIRTTNAERQEIPVNLKNILASKAQDLSIQDNDILFVPRSRALGLVKGIGSTLPSAAGAVIYRIP